MADDFDPDAYLKEKDATVAAANLDPGVRGRSIMAPKVGAGETFINDAANIIPLGGRFVDAASALALNPLRQPGIRLTPDARAALEARGETVPEGESLLQSYRNARDLRTFRTAAGNQQNPGTGKAGTGFGLLLSALAPLPGLKSAKGAGLISRLATMTGNGAIYGGLGGLTEGSADLTRGEFGNALGQTTLGALIGGGLGLGLGGAGEAGIKIWNLLKGAVKPAPAAQTLMNAGVKDLTLGQMTPGSGLAQIEEAATSVPIIGDGIQLRRAAGRESYQDAITARGNAPGAAPLSEGSPAERLSEAYGNFVPAYGEIKANAVSPRTPGGVPLSEALPAAADNLDVLADDIQRGAARNYLRGQKALVEQGAGNLPAGMPSHALPDDSSGAVPLVLADRLLQARHNIRGKIAEALQRQDHPTAQLLERAERELTGALEEQLGPEAAAKLRATDAQYAQHKIIQKAIARAKDRPGGFTPNDLSEEVRKATEPGLYARGGGGTLRDLAAAGREVFDVKNPATGVRSVVLGLPPFKQLSATGAALMNTPSGQKFMLGGYGFQAKMQALESAFVQRELAKALQAASGTRSLGLGTAETMLAPPAPVFADDGSGQPETLASLSQRMRGGQ